MEGKTQNIPVREEYKYIVSHDLYRHLRQDIGSFIAPDPHILQDKNHYIVSSIYFENSELQSYLTKINGLAKRYKLRIRTYPSGTTDTVSLEIKYKLYDKGSKHKTTIDKQTRDRLLSSLQNKLTGRITDPVFEQSMRYIRLHNFIPFIQIDYNRAAFYGRRDKKVRITFDSDIKCMRYQKNIPLSPYIPVLPNSNIMEIKTSGYFPFWLTYCIKKYGLKRTAVSKYAYSVQRLAINSSLCVR
ncbi:MAG: VTC domain-containing protein [Candidatus Roizmanbacteria bacterium GW2011_GWA2_37_7]|uniref:VTC domain-containing protein n=1 Tax=Candidatus Roizmanbacteria bacterium GW2011_GWA2_37_7 TaxID=1618481 RepID=A0A0G0HJT6_9BACT|nr:MAG: VTC domain-containing protein [Candidatus Roizmanbacteria bacterium GW2011_GWA2_37_7]